MGSRGTCRPSIRSRLNPEPGQHRAQPRDARPARRWRDRPQTWPCSVVACSGARARVGFARRRPCGRRQRRHHRDRAWRTGVASGAPGGKFAIKLAEKWQDSPPARPVGMSRRIAVRARRALPEQAELHLENLHASVRDALRAAAPKRHWRRPGENAKSWREWSRLREGQRQPRRNRAARFTRRLSDRQRPERLRARISIRVTGRLCAVLQDCFACLGGFFVGHVWMISVSRRDETLQAVANGRHALRMRL
jgi:hypothetical protein